MKFLKGKIWLKKKLLSTILIVLLLVKKLNNETFIFKFAQIEI